MLPVENESQFMPRGYTKAVSIKQCAIRMKCSLKKNRLLLRGKRIAWQLKGCGFDASKKGSELRP